MKQKSLYRITTHLRIEYRWAYSSRQAAYIVYATYRKAGLDKSFVWCLERWTAQRKVN